MIFSDCRAQVSNVYARSFSININFSCFQSVMYWTQMFLCVFCVCLYKTDIDAAREITSVTFQLLFKPDQCALSSHRFSSLYYYYVIIQVYQVMCQLMCHIYIMLHGVTFLLPSDSVFRYVCTLWTVPHNLRQ